MALPSEAALIPHYAQQSISFAGQHSIKTPVCIQRLNKCCCFLILKYTRILFAIIVHISLFRTASAGTWLPLWFSCTSSLSLRPFGHFCITFLILLAGQGCNSFHCSLRCHSRTEWWLPVWLGSCCPYAVNQTSVYWGQKAPLGTLRKRSSLTVSRLVNGVVCTAAQHEVSKIQIKRNA